MSNSLRLMSYNIKNMYELFDSEKKTIKGELKGRLSAINNIMAKTHPNLLAVIEAPPEPWQNEVFVKQRALKALAFQAIAPKQSVPGPHSLAFYYREPLELLEVDPCTDFYQPWVMDIDEDSIDEYLAFDRIPLEALFQLRGTNIRFLAIAIALKSKLVNQAVDIRRYEYLSIANRKKLLAQAIKLRERLDKLLSKQPELPIMVMGDVNDSPELDSFEREIGFSALEALMGNVFQPENIFRNTLAHIFLDKQKKSELYTCKFTDPIFVHAKKHRVWIDHILLSPHFYKSAQLSYVVDSGRIEGQKNPTQSDLASDHLPVYCDIQVG